MKITRKHGMSKEDAKEHAFAMLPGLFDVLADVIDEFLESEEGVLFWADNYWGEEFMNDIDGFDAPPRCATCGEPSVITSVVKSPKGRDVTFSRCPCCADRACPHNLEKLWEGVRDA